MPAEKISGVLRTVKRATSSDMKLVGGTEETDALVCRKTTRVSELMRNSREREELLSKQHVICFYGDEHLIPCFHMLKTLK